MTPTINNLELSDKYIIMEIIQNQIMCTRYKLKFIFIWMIQVSEASVDSIRKYTCSSFSAIVGTAAAAALL